jgi:hypothetical protein
MLPLMEEFYTIQEKVFSRELLLVRMGGVSVSPLV